MPLHQSDATTKPPRSPVTPFAIVTALVLDVALVVIFVAIGRGQHDLAESLPGLWATAWPFLGGLALAWLLGCVWRHPWALLRGGLVVWIGTVVFGLLARVLLTDGGAALPFVIVATLTLAVFLLGWRLLAHFLRSLRNRSATMES